MVRTVIWVTINLQSFLVIIVLGGGHILPESLLRVPLKLSISYSVYVWIAQFHQEALASPVSFCFSQGIWIVDRERGKMRWRIGRIKHCVESCDGALQETFVWLKHLRIQTLFSFLIYNDSSGPQMSRALHAPPRLSFCDSPQRGRNIAHRIQIELGFLENWLLEGRNRVSTSKYNSKEFD